MSDSHPLHTDRSYEDELNELRQALLMMAGRVEDMMTRALEALQSGDNKLARKTIDRDAAVNQAEIDIDDLCLQILARRQPMASDLRLIATALKMSTDLERIGDLAVNICERAIDMNRWPDGLSRDEVEEMAQIVIEMLGASMNAFSDRDSEAARQVIERDQAVDDLYTQIFRAALDMMKDHPERLEAGIHVLSVVKWLERIADHTTNLCEQVVFMVKGKDIRHPGKL